MQTIALTQPEFKTFSRNEFESMEIVWHEDAVDGRGRVMQSPSGEFWSFDRTLKGAIVAKREERPSIMR